LSINVNVSAGSHCWPLRCGLEVGSVGCCIGARPGPAVPGSATDEPDGKARLPQSRPVIHNPFCLRSGSRAYQLPARGQAKIATNWPGQYCRRPPIMVNKVGYQSRQAYMTTSGEGAWTCLGQRELYVNTGLRICRSAGAVLTGGGRRADVEGGRSWWTHFVFGPSARCFV